MAESIKIKSNIKVYAIENEDGSRVLAELRLDPKNDATLSHFLDLADRAKTLGDDTRKKLEDLNGGSDVLTTEQAVKALEINKDAINVLISETDKLFGAGFTKKIFAEHYEIDDNFLPSIELFSEFYTQVMPIVQKVYTNSQKHYSVKKGK